MEMVVKFVFLTYTEHKQGSFDSKDPLRPFLHFPFITFLLAQHTPKIIPTTDKNIFSMARTENLKKYRS